MAGRAVNHRDGLIHLNQLLNAGAAIQNFRHLTGSAPQIDGQGKAAFDVVQPVAQGFADISHEKVEAVEISRRPIPMAPYRAAIKYAQALIRQLPSPKNKTSKKFVAGAENHPLRPA
jgi:hypothetical protein